MKTSSKIIAVIVPIVIIIAILGILGMMGANNQKHHEFCSNWSQQIDIAKKQLKSEFLPGDNEIAQVNNMVDNYNQKCAF